MRTVYIADDGTEFSDKTECEEYETLKIFKINNIPMLDDKFTWVDTNSFESFNDFELCEYIKVNSKEDLKILKEIYNWTGYEVPNSVGEFYYDHDEYCWKKIDSKIFVLKEEIKFYENIKERLSLKNG